MVKERLAPHVPEVNEPPRDGEFFVEEDGMEVRLAGGLEQGVTALIAILDSIGRGAARHPVLALGLAVATSSVVTSLVLQF